MHPGAIQGMSEGCVATMRHTGQVGKAEPPTAKADREPCAGKLCVITENGSKSVQFHGVAAPSRPLSNTRVLSLVWDNAPWRISHALRSWIREHNRQVKRAGEGVRMLACPLPIKSPWQNPIEPKWMMHGKRRVAEPGRTLSAQELADRVCTAFGCDHEDHLAVPENAS
jgi:hypothetical protein